MIALQMSEGIQRSPISRGPQTVFVVDDDVSVRESLEGLIATEGWQPVVFASAQEFLSYPLCSAPSCLILDLSLPDINGLELQERLAVGGSELPIIIITGHGDVPTTVRAMKAGAVEVLTKPFVDEDLLVAIRNSLTTSSAAIELKARHRALEECYDSLSPREREVMGLVIQGHLNKTVGFQLGISEITVKAHRGQVMRKMKARSFAELVNIGAKLGLGQHN